MGDRLCWFRIFPSFISDKPPLMVYRFTISFIENYRTRWWTYKKKKRKKRRKRVCVLSPISWRVVEGVETHRGTVRTTSGGTGWWCQRSLAWWSLVFPNHSLDHVRLWPLLWWYMFPLWTIDGFWLICTRKQRSLTIQSSWYHPNRYNRTFGLDWDLSPWSCRWCSPLVFPLMDLK